MEKFQRQTLLARRLNGPITLNIESSPPTRESVFPPLQDSQVTVMSVVRNDDKRILTVSESKRESLHDRAARKTTTAKRQERDYTKRKSYNWADTCENQNKLIQNYSESTDEVKESTDHKTGCSKTRRQSRRHGTSKPARSRKTSSLDCAIPVDDFKQIYPKKGREILAKSEVSGFEERRCSSQTHVDRTHAQPATTSWERTSVRSPCLPPIKDTLVTSSSLYSPAPPLTPNAALLPQNWAVSPIAKAGFTFDAKTRERKRHGKLPPLSLPQGEPALIVVPPTPTSKKPGSLPKLNPIRSQLLSSTSSTSSNGEQWQSLSQSVPSNWGKQSMFSTPIHSSKSLEFSFSPHTPSHLSHHSLTLSDSTLSSLDSPISQSPASSSSPFTYSDGDADDVFCHYPLPPPSSSKKSNNRRRERPGRRLVPLNKAEHPVQIKLDSTSNNLEEIEDAVHMTRSTKSSRSGSETKDDQENEFLEEYLRICPGRRGAICEKLEKNMNVVKINGKKYNLTTLRNELTEMMNAVKKYDLFFKTLKFFR